MLRLGYVTNFLPSFPLSFPPPSHPISSDCHCPVLPCGAWVLWHSSSQAPPHPHLYPVHHRTAHFSTISSIFDLLCPVLLPSLTYKHRHRSPPPATPDRFCSLGLLPRNVPTQATTISSQAHSLVNFSPSSFPASCQPVCIPLAGRCFSPLSPTLILRDRRHKNTRVIAHASQRGTLPRPPSGKSTCAERCRCMHNHSARAFATVQPPLALPLFCPAALPPPRQRARRLRNQVPHCYESRV